MDGKREVSASTDGTLAVWDNRAGELIASFVADSAVYECAVAFDGLTVVAGDVQGWVHFLRLENVSSWCSVLISTVYSCLAVALLVVR